MTAIIDPAGLAHLAAVIERCRHDWNTPGIRTALETALTRHPYPTVALVAIASARDPSARTPGVIAVRCTNGWTGNDTTEPPTRTPTRVADLRCGRCGNTATEPNHAEHCSRRAEPDHAAEYATVARKGAQAGRIIARARANPAPEETP